MKRKDEEDALERKLRSLAAPPGEEGEESFRARVLARAEEALLSRVREAASGRPFRVGRTSGSAAEILSGWARVLIPAGALSALVLALLLGPLVDRWQGPAPFATVRSGEGEDPVLLAVSGASNATVADALFSKGPTYVDTGD
jgi:hypothetical protein